MCASLHSIVPIISQLGVEGRHLYLFHVNLDLG
jgi:hypothetical protein